MLRVLVTAILASLLVAGDFDPPGTEVIVGFNRSRFEPATVEVRRGTRVTFHNMDAGADTYSIAAADGSFESEPLGRDGEWTHRFLSDGEHEYFVKQHPETKGMAIVK
jgi:plastocyanin